MDKCTLENLLEFINRFSTEPNLSWSVPHLYEKEDSFQIQWVLDKTTSINWYFKKKKEEVWNVSSSPDFIKYLISEKVDLVHFEVDLLKAICIQAICSYYYIEKASELIGRDKIDVAINLMKQVLEEKPKNKDVKLTLIKRKKKPVKDES